MLHLGHLGSYHEHSRSRRDALFFFGYYLKNNQPTQPPRPTASPPHRTLPGSSHASFRGA